MQAVAAPNTVAIVSVVTRVRFSPAPLSKLDEFFLAPDPRGNIFNPIRSLNLPAPRWVPESEKAFFSESSYLTVGSTIGTTWNLWSISLFTDTPNST